MTYETGLAGHSSVYHKESRSIYVFGGYLYEKTKVVASNEFYRIDLQTNQWHLIPARDSTMVSLHCTRVVLFFNYA